MANTTGRKIVACRVEYETKDKTNWKANVLAYSMKDAVQWLRTNVKEFDRYVSTQILGEIDAIESQVFSDYFAPKETKVVETVVETVVVPSDEERQPQCPWCDKEFKNKLTLGTHIKKYHMGE